jgi:beta-fructofuranosidase
MDKSSIAKWVLIVWTSSLLSLETVAPGNERPESVQAYQKWAEGERDRLQQSDPDLPRIHYIPPRGFLGDPNGLIHHQGKYHLFYQHNPQWPKAGPAHWGHAVSEDLLHWQDWPIALAPTPNGPDKDGCYSGCAVIDTDGTPTLIYTGISPQVQCLATSKDWVVWQKYEQNPILANPGIGEPLLGWRDPYVWREGDEWRMTISSGITDKGGAVLLYRAKDLRGPWSFMHPLFICREWLMDSPYHPNFECVSFVPLGPKWLLVASAEHHQRAYWFLGDYREGRFYPETSGALDGNLHKYPATFYAPQVFRDAQGRVLMFGWLRESRSRPELAYSGAMSLPRLLTLRSDGRLGMAPAPELQKLRDRHWHVESQTITDAGMTDTLKDIRGKCLEILAEIVPQDAPRIELHVLLDRNHKNQDEKRRQQTTIAVHGFPIREIQIQRGQASRSPHVAAGDVVHRFERLRDEKSLRLHVFVDYSIVEAFVNGRCCVTARVYPANDQAVGIDLRALGGRAVVKSLDVWTLRPIWPPHREKSTR